MTDHLADLFALVVTTGALSAALWLLKIRFHAIFFAGLCIFYALRLIAMAGEALL